MAEDIVLSAHRTGHFNTLSLRPHLIMGPGDPNLVPRLIAKAKAGRLRIVGNGKNKVDVVHVVNAAYAHVCALTALSTRPEACGGRAYFIGQEHPVELWPFINEILAMANVAPVTKKIPQAVGVVLGRVFETVYSSLNLYHRDPPMTRFIAKQLSCDHYFDHTAAHERLGYRPLKGLDELRRDLKASLSSHP
jgi:nucleoside-diphosphate-sugar epimerase